MVKIAFAVYRQWGYDIFKNILAFQQKKQSFILDTLILPTEYQCIIDKEIKKKINIYIVDPNNTKQIQNILTKQKIDIVCFYSWSWIVKKPLLDTAISLCLHPSLLPRYRGGTPIQHQIINKEKKGGITIFQMDTSIDGGPIYKQTPISLKGTVDDIFRRMTTYGTKITKSLLNDATHNKLTFSSQKYLEKYPPNKRRTPSQSEVKIENVKNMSFEDLYNLVRGLLDPYPNVFIQLNHTKISLQKIARYKKPPKYVYIVSEDRQDLPKNKAIFLKLKDYYAKLVRYTIS